MPNKKESLSIMTVKTLLAVVIFTGVGTIIIGGGWLIGKQSKISEPAKKNVVADSSKTEDEVADWQIYSSSQDSFTFEYPQDWEITENYFYETAAGIKAKNPTIILQKIGDDNSNDWIRINARQFNCEHGKCVEASYITIGTYSKDLETLNILDRIAESFKKIEVDETADWKTYRDEEYGLEMKYPEEFLSTQPLQPKTKAIQCNYANFINSCPAEKITINSMPFCLQKTDGAAAGTTYTTYNYTTVRNKECFTVSFTVPYPNCVNYLPVVNQETQEAYDKCRLDNEIIKPETINQILSTFKFIEK